MRVALTIILNGNRHLLHNYYWLQMVDMFDLWVIVEGVAKNSGSTSWCNTLPDNCHLNHRSNDNTTELIDSIASSNTKVKIVRTLDGPWESKDDQVNAGIHEILKYTNKAFLWQVDIDEQWTPEQLKIAEQELEQGGGKTGYFLSNYYVGPNQVALGEWGEGRSGPYRRLWDWKGELFETHEPPKLVGKNGPGLLLTPRFNHYAYYFDTDVKFKEIYYQGYNGLYDRWVKVQENRGILPIRALLGDKIWWSNTNTSIKYVP